MASNTQQFGIRGPSQTRMVNEIGAASNQRLENQLTELTSLVRQLAVGQHQPALAAKVCGICTSVEHPTDMCPTLQETESDQPENVGAIATWETAILARTDLRAICSSTIRVHTECISETSRVSTANSAISSTTFPTTTAATESAYPRQLPIFGRLSEVACNQQPGVPAISHCVELTSLVRQLVVGQHQPALAAKVCGICTSVEHPTDMCPTLQETESDQPENVGAIATWETAILARTDLGAICSSTIRVHTECISETSRVSTTDSAISSTTFPTATTTTESAYPRQLAIFGRLNEVAYNQQSATWSSSNL
ncbi:hypothetical protein CR513_05993, partial [Mucuna pruriens]